MVFVEKVSGELGVAASFEVKGQRGELSRLDNGFGVGCSFDQFCLVLDDVFQFVLLDASIDWFE